MPASPIDWLNWVVHFVASGQSENEGVYTPTQFYITDLSSAGTNDFSKDPDLLSISPLEFTPRLALLLNSYWTAGIAPYDFTGKIINDTEAVTPIQVIGSSTSTALVYHTSGA